MAKKGRTASGMQKYRRGKAIAIALAVLTISLLFTSAYPAMRALYLIDKLDNDNVEARALAVRELVKMGPAAVEILIGALKDGEVLVRCGAARALGEIGDARAVPYLMEVLDDRRNEYLARQSAAHALGKVRDPRAIPSLIAVLGEQDGDVGWAAEGGLATMGSPAVPALIAALVDRGTSSAEAAARTLGEIHDPRAVEALLLLIREGRPKEGEWAADALGDSRERRAVEPLITALRNRADTSWAMKRFRGRAAEALGKIGDARAVEPLIEALQDINVRSLAVWALGEIRDPRALAPLLRLSIADAGSCRDEHLPGWINGAITKLGESPDALHSRAAPAIAWLLRQLKSSDALIRERSALLLGRMKVTRAVAPIAGLLGDESSSVRVAAAQALGVIDNPRAAAPLVRAIHTAIKYHDSSLAWEIASSLKCIGKPAITPLVSVLQEREEMARVVAANALGGIGDPAALAPLLGALRDGSPRVRLEVVKSLGTLGEAGAVEPLAAMMHGGEPRLRYAAADALGDIGAPAAPSLIRAFAIEDGELRKKLEAILSRMGAAAFDALEEASRTEGKEVRIGAVIILGRSAEPRAIAALVSASKDPDPRVRDAAAEMLARKSGEHYEKAMEKLRHGSFTTENTESTEIE